jgi:formate hydrogenlyase transcriptional activator
LLSVLQEREIERVGGSRPIPINVRIIAATNRSIRTLVEDGSFREDLYYRLNVFPLRLPSLRERIGDIPLLVEYLIERYAKNAGKEIKHIGKRTMELFQRYDWPGNIRELQNVIERAVILSNGSTFNVDEHWLRPIDNTLSRAKTELEVRIHSRDVLAERGLGRIDEDRQREIIEAALSRCGGRVGGPHGAALVLGVPRQTLESKIVSLGINKDRFKSSASV